MDKETELLSRLAANHLHLAQFEPLRAILLSLRRKSPDLALEILQTVVASSGRFEDILWSASCPNPSLLTYLSALELLQYGSDSTSQTWSFSPRTLRLRAEFLLLVQVLIDRVKERRRRSNGDDVDLDDNNQEEEEKDVEISVLEKILELGASRLKPDISVNSEEGLDFRVVSIEEEELMCLKKAVLEEAGVFDALCSNILEQIKGREAATVTTGLEITVGKDEKLRNFLEEEEAEALKVFSFIMKCVQLANLDAIKECLSNIDVDGAISHVRFLSLDRGVDEAEYRYVYL